MNMEELRVLPQPVERTCSATQLPHIEMRMAEQLVPLPLAELICLAIPPRLTEMSTDKLLVHQPLEEQTCSAIRLRPIATRTGCQLALPQQEERICLAIRRLPIAILMVNQLVRLPQVERICLVIPLRSSAAIRDSEYGLGNFKTYRHEKVLDYAGFWPLCDNGILSLIHISEPTRPG